MEGSDAIFITAIVFLSISLAAVSLRCYVRLGIVKAFGHDDALMVAATIFNIGFATCGIVGAVYGMGKTPVYLAHHQEDLRRGLLIPRVKCWWLGQILYVFTCTIARLSIATTLLRLTIHRTHSYILYGVVTFSTTVGIVFLFFTIFQCHPVAYYWNHYPETGHCLGINILLGIVYMYSGVAAMCDIILGSLPILMIWSLQMDRRTKCAVSGILGIAGIASAAVIVRFPFLHHAKDPEFLYSTTQISIWSNVEANLGITAGSLVTVRPFLRAFAAHHSLPNN